MAILPEEVQLVAEYPGPELTQFERLPARSAYRQSAQYTRRCDGSRIVTVEARYSMDIRELESVPPRQVSGNRLRHPTAGARACRFGQRRAVAHATLTPTCCAAARVSPDRSRALRGRPTP